MKNGQDVKVVSLLSNTQKTADAWTKYVDTAGFEQLTIVVEANMTTADASNYFTPIVKEADSAPTATGSYSTATDVANSSLAAIIATGAATAQQVDYVGSKRYVAILLDETLTADGVFTVTAILSKPKKSPAKDQSVTTGTVS